MATSDAQLVVGWTQSQLTRICQLLYQKYPVLQEIKYSHDDASDVRIDAKISSPTFIMPETGKPELFMVLRIRTGKLTSPKYIWKMENWRFAYRCDLSRADLKVSLSSEGLFQCLNTILDTDINEVHTMFGDEWPVADFKEEKPGSFEEINRGFKKWMSDMSTKGLTQWGYRFPPPAKSSIAETQLVVMDLMKMAGLSNTAQSPRGLFYFEPTPDYETLDKLDEIYRHAIGVSVWTASKRDKVKPDLPPKSADPEAELDNLYGVGTLYTHCDPAVLNEDFLTRTRLLKRTDPTADNNRDPNILRSKIKVMGFIPGADVGGDTETIPPINLVENKAAIEWKANCQGLKPLTGEPMSIVFKGENTTEANVDFLYLQLRFQGGTNGTRLATTSLTNTITATVRQKPDVQAKVYHLSVRGTMRVVVQLSPDKPTDTRIRIAPKEKIEVELSGLAGTAGTHNLDFTESLVDSRSQSGTRGNSKWTLDIAPAPSY